MERACLRWAVDITKLAQTDAEWQFLLGLLPSSEQQDVTRFKFKDDQKRALVSRLLQRQCCHQVLGIPCGDIEIHRTKGKKPFLASLNPVADIIPNFNFNVSHEGHFVVLASEGLCIVGIDVAAPQQIRRVGDIRPTSELLQMFRDQFTPHEWQCIRTGHDDRQMERAFRRHWSLKEAFLKARGDGIVFPLQRCEFRFPENNVWADEPSVAVDNVLQPQWAFHLDSLPDDHFVSVARGPPKDILDAFGEFTRTLKRPAPSAEELGAAMRSPHPDFTFLAGEDLVPPERRDLFRASFGTAQ
eukprot:TRINITY_DN5456_c0_g1_i1.p1 TRINITY_DN5456_c0_g1~~TRINITY_DN5456_c0_g1_i1.p1  ORF type:complete len:308 (+),score=39.52 TRINITY_DN5456_c0_g1_i1:25-924(+)